MPLPVNSPPVAAESTAKVAGIVLCGGRSLRMGIAKLSLPFGAETMLARVVRRLAEVCEPIVVVAAQGQELPPLPIEVLVVRDRHPDRGPLEGLRAGLAALPADVEIAAVTTCDAPLLVPGFACRLVELLGGHDAAAPYIDGYYHPLSAVYRKRVLSQIEAMLTADCLRVRDLLARLDSLPVAAGDLASVDPDLYSLRNLNLPRDYLDALRIAGFAAPPELLAQWNAET